jgi:hypothetical protein
VLVELGAVPVGVVETVIIVPVQDPEPPPGKGPEFGEASPIALVVIILMALATIVLIRSMSKRLRKLPASFDGEDPAASEDTDTTDDTSASRSDTTDSTDSADVADDAAAADEPDAAERPRETAAPGTPATAGRETGSAEDHPRA